MRRMTNFKSLAVHLKKNFSVTFLRLTHTVIYTTYPGQSQYEAKVLRQVPQSFLSILLFFVLNEESAN